MHLQKQKKVHSSPISVFFSSSQRGASKSCRSWVVYETQLEGFDTGRRFYLIKYRQVIPSELPEASFTVTEEELVSPGHKVILRQNQREVR